MVNISKDLIWGEKKEVELLSTLEKKFNKLKITTGFCLYDYFNDEVLIELKSRRIPHNKYPSAMMGLNKINFFLKSNKKCYCYFNYTDGLYYFEVNKESVSKCIKGIGGRNDRGEKERYKMLYIPSSLLIKH